MELGDGEARIALVSAGDLRDSGIEMSGEVIADENDYAITKSSKFSK